MNNADSPRRIIGIDPGLANCGFGVIETLDGRRYRAVEWATVRTESKQPMSERLQQIFAEIDRVVERTQASELALESIYFAKNVSSAIKVAEVCGVVRVLAAQRQMPCADYTPLQVKQSMVSYGRATKDQMQKMVKMMLKMPEQPSTNHAADALAVALCHAQIRRFENKLAKRGGQR